VIRKRLGLGLERLGAFDVLLLAGVSFTLGCAGAPPLGPAPAIAAALGVAALCIWFAGAHPPLPPAVSDLVGAIDFTHGWAFRCDVCERPFVFNAYLRLCTLVTCQHMAPQLNRSGTLLEREMPDGRLKMKIDWDQPRGD
jgi:hypothetical protein